MKYCAVSIDVDPIDCYFGIHGLESPPTDLRSVVIDRAIPRFLKLLAELHIPATFFIVGRDLDEKITESANLAEKRLKSALELNHELANHSFWHRYVFSDQPIDMLKEDIVSAHAIVEEKLNYQMQGFRCPGYDLSPNVAQVLTELGYAYDSSYLPSPPYFAAKQLAMTASQIRGRKSSARMTDPRGLTVGCTPYRINPEKPWKKGGGIVEIPISTTRISMIPVIGTFVAMASPAVCQVALASVAKRNFFNFELHGIDLIDAEKDGIPGGLVAKQPDLRIPLKVKRERIRNALTKLQTSHTFETLSATAGRTQLATRTSIS